MPSWHGIPAGPPLVRWPLVGLLHGVYRRLLQRGRSVSPASHDGRFVVNTHLGTRCTLSSETSTYYNYKTHLTHESPQQQGCGSRRGAGRDRGPPGRLGWAGRERLGSTWPRCRLMLVLDAGAFLAVEHGDHDEVALVKRERSAGRPPVTSGSVVAQVWRGGRGRPRDPVLYPVRRGRRIGAGAGGVAVLEEQFQGLVGVPPRL